MIPTRLIDVGEEGQESVRLCEMEKWNTDQKRELRYIALSYPWGIPSRHEHTFTTRENFGRFVHGIAISDLPHTLRDAVQITRGLGLRYIWIDALCIIQGPGGDWIDEAKHMEMIFGNAYCVIAADRATGSSSGFLQERPTRKFVRFEKSPAGSLYVCEAIDDFQRDLIDGRLRMRAWVLQERALARRTIYFTETQTYWECGIGIRCETLTRMRKCVVKRLLQNDGYEAHNSFSIKAAFLGDPNFPQLATNMSKGGQINVFLHLYEYYSRLHLSRPSDKAVAIAGVEKRIIRAFDTQGGFGVFERYLGRSLLWHRDPDLGYLRKIEYPEHQNSVPTWSWMAYDGAITFIEISFGGVVWETEEIHSPWSTGHTLSPPPEAIRLTDSYRNFDLLCRVRDFNLALAGTQVRIFYDLDETSQARGQGVKCVVVGKQRAEPGVANVAELEFYVLLVALRHSGQGTDVYERVGAASLPGICIDLNEPGRTVRVS